MYIEERKKGDSQENENELDSSCPIYDPRSVVFVIEVTPVPRRLQPARRLKPIPR